MANDYPANVKLYKDGQCKSFSNIMSHTLTDDELPGADKGRAVNLIDQALANGWWWNREGKPACEVIVPAAPVEMAWPVVASDLGPVVAEVDTFDPDPVVAVIDVPLDVPETPRKPRSSKR